MSDLYYLQDNRSYVGNDILWWAKNGAGYTTDLSRAEVYTKEDAIRKNRNRETDVPWPKNYVDAHTRPAVDMQYVDIETALKNTGIKLYKQPKVKSKREYFNCGHCGKFVTQEDWYTRVYMMNPCSHCEKKKSINLYE